MHTQVNISSSHKRFSLDKSPLQSESLAGWTLFINHMTTSGCVGGRDTRVTQRKTDLLPAFRN